MKQWIVHMICGECGYIERFILTPTEIYWSCPDCGKTYNVLASCGIDTVGLSTMQIADEIEDVLGRPDRIIASKEK